MLLSDADKLVVLKIGRVAPWTKLKRQKKCKRELEQSTDCEVLPYWVSFGTTFVRAA
jgi:hypothetical protein